PPAATIAATSPAVAGAIALASTNRPPNPATRRPTSSAAWGGQTEKMIDERLAISVSATPVSPAASARSLVATPRPSGTHSTRCPAPARHLPTAAPISPGCSSPIVVSVMPLFSPGAGPGAEAGVHDDARHRRQVQRGELVPVDDPDPAVGNDHDEHPPRRAGPQHLGQHIPGGRDFPVPEDAQELPGPGGVLGEAVPAVRGLPRLPGPDPEVHRAGHDRRPVRRDDGLVSSVGHLEGAP